jgi:hypothetical protein
MFPCSCCGFLTLAEPQGSYEICEVCGWEDDEVQQRWPGYRGGANHESLCEAQAALLKRIAADVQVTHGVRRASEWRPLRLSECVGAEADPDRDPHVYYWHRDVNGRRDR